MSRRFISHCTRCGKRAAHRGLYPICGGCNEALSHARVILCPHESCGAKFKLDRLRCGTGEEPALSCPKCQGVLENDVPLRPEMGWALFRLYSITAWWPACRRRLALREEAERRYESDYELWSRECRRLEGDRCRRIRAAEEQQERFSEAIKTQAGAGALEYVAVRHRKVWNDNAGRIDGLVRSRYLALAGQPNTRSQLLRACHDAIPSLIEGLAGIERIEIREGLTLERLARTAPDDHGLFAGEWFVEQFDLAFRQHADWKDLNPNAWEDLRNRFEPRERGIAFERYLKDVLERAGCEAVQTTKTSGDYGADLLINHRGRTIIVQAKSYSENVGLEAVQQVEAARRLYRAEEAWVITDSDFTAPARVLAAENNVQLIDGNCLDLVGVSVLAGARTILTPSAEPAMMELASETTPNGHLPAGRSRGGVMAPAVLAAVRRYGVQTLCAILAAIGVGGGAVWVASANSRTEQRMVLAAVDQWAATTRSLNLDGLLACYAPRLKRFYRLSDIGRDEVARNKRDAFRSFSETRTYRLRNVVFERLDAREAAVVFDKDWDFRDRKSNRRYAGSGRQRLTLERFGAAWLITGEEELAVYAVTGSAADRR